MNMFKNYNVVQVIDQKMFKRYHVKWKVFYNYTARASCTASTTCRLNKLHNSKLDGTPNETFPISSMEHTRLNGFLRLCKLWFIWPLGFSALDASGVPRERDSNDT